MQNQKPLGKQSLDGEKNADGETIREKVSKNGPSEICRRQPLKYLK